MTRTRFAIPLAIDLILSDKVATVSASLMLDRLRASLIHVEADREKGRREVLARRDELIAKGTPDVLLTGMPRQAEQTTAVTIRWDEWPDNFVCGHICDSNPELYGPSFALGNQDFAFAKFAAMELGKALKASAHLESPFNESIETEFVPKDTSAADWIRNYYNMLDSSGARHDPITKTITPFPKRQPNLRELESWQPTIKNAVVCFLEQSRKVNADSITDGFSTYAGYAEQYVSELSEFGEVKHCWSVDLEGSHHNQAFIEYDDWFALIRLSGVPSGLLSPS